MIPKLDTSKIVQVRLKETQYYQEEFPKKQIVLHHTVSNGNAKNVMSWWAKTPAKVGTAFAWTTLELQVGLVAAGGTPSTGAIATHSFVTGGAAGDESFGTYQSAKTYANPKLKVKGGTLYELGIVQRPTGGIVAGTIKQIKIQYRRARSYDAD